MPIREALWEVCRELLIALLALSVLSALVYSLSILYSVVWVRGPEPPSMTVTTEEPNSMTTCPMAEDMCFLLCDPSTRFPPASAFPRQSPHIKRVRWEQHDGVWCPTMCECEP